MKICVTDKELSEIVCDKLTRVHIDISVDDIKFVIYGANKVHNLEFDSLRDVCEEIDVIVNTFLFFYS